MRLRGASRSFACFIAAFAFRRHALTAATPGRPRSVFCTLVRLTVRSALKGGRGASPAFGRRRRKRAFLARRARVFSDPSHVPLHTYIRTRGLQGANESRIQNGRGAAPLEQLQQSWVLGTLQRAGKSVLSSSTVGILKMEVEQVTLEKKLRAPL